MTKGVTYTQFKTNNDKVKKQGVGFQPVQIYELIISPKGVGNDMVRLSTGQTVRIEGLINSITYGMNCVTNPSKLKGWRGFVG